jgi:hypothetical protein
MLTGSNNNLVPPIYDSWTSQQKRPISISIPETENNKTQLLTNDSLTFSSQPVIKATSKIAQYKKKHTWTDQCCFKPTQK